MKNIHKELKKLGIEIKTHYSDLYVLVTEETTKLVKDYDYAESVTKFISEIDNKQYFNIPLANEDFKIRCK